MRSYLTLLAAVAVFLAFIGLRPEDLRTAASADVELIEPAADSLAAPRPEGTNAAPGDSAPLAEVLDAPAARAETAFASISRTVSRQSHPDALRSAFRAYFNYRATHPEAVRKPYLYFVDFGLDSRTPRGYVFDMESLTVVEGPFTVSHGRGSVQGNAGLPTRFSNVRGSNATSLGLYLAQETYAFSGRSGGRSYRSIGLRLQGLSGRFNSAARARGIVVHGAPYVTAANAGRSEGCPAMEPRLAQELIPRIANGGLVFLFSPEDRTWLREDPWAQARPGGLASSGG